ncbi:hypothetical protein LPW11_00520 [Geomonas sp. RF6]|uniref:hypothetical protein n=1 Tax=Geomonas sp. RF6 TaxID=2897342 RepID=UPI001E3C64C9|nr:hypothetical protein [Geomonas sp. RF6]UFS70689.1 hypothetical protein LPW11_00520 [Geomonas sp. RF6]
MKGVLLVLLLLGYAVSAHAERVWLVVQGSDSTPVGIARKARALGGKGVVVQTSDCGDPRGIYAIAASVETTPQAAQTALRKTREIVPDAYLKICEVKRASLLAFRVPAVDPSIADVPPGAVNWEDRDRVSTAKALPGGRALIIRRSYEDAADDPLEGRRERVLLGESQKLTPLENNCIDAANATTLGSYIAFQCAREEAGRHLLHDVVVFSGAGVKVKEIRHCRNPRLLNGGRLSCERESVSSSGDLQLSRKEYAFR